MTDITINIKTGSEDSEPKVTTTTDNATAIVPKTESPKLVSPKVETPKAETRKNLFRKKNLQRDTTQKKWI